MAHLKDASSGVACSGELVCVICGTDEKTSSCESWAGSWHSACQHAYCNPCLQQHINTELKSCHESTLEVYCYVAGCPKRLPQKMVLCSSAEAGIYANVIDSGSVVRACAHCQGISSKTCGVGLMNEACQHSACALCWVRWMIDCVPAAVQNLSCDIPCIEPGCRAGCRTMLNHHAIAPEVSRSPELYALKSHLADVDAQLQKLRETKTTLHTADGEFALAVLHRPDDFKSPTCPVCQDVAVALVSDPGCAPHHAACGKCWGRWAEEQLDACVAHCRVAARCIWPECSTNLSTHLGVWYEAARHSEPVKQLTRKLEHRAHLQRSTLFPAPMQVECPLVGCVGIGYLGYDTVMCFMCEHQWVPSEPGEPAAQELENMEEIMGVAVKKCPSCNEYIEKNGGCDHMTCRCKHEFYWTTLKPYRQCSTF
mmetsp:Transcript_54595/g.127674  ORF Transcript_54595/g.127674 Transcript_54595/m.127674 type:complete len:425 (-) Transcript_54595:143-1417(-)